MYYYKTVENNQIISIETRRHKVTAATMIEITSDEYQQLLSEMIGKFEKSTSELIHEEQAKAERIAALEAENSKLEAENAGLLYQVLTGEELSNA